MSSTHEHPTAPSEIAKGRLRLIRRIAGGGMSDVWEALDRRDGCAVAVKILREGLAMDRESRLRFQREARILRHLGDPAIARLLGCGREAGTTYIVMDYVEGETLFDHMVRNGALEPAEALRIGREVADALAVAHAAGIIHRDLKPENVILRGPERRVTVIDFGIARIARSKLTRPGQFLGTFGYAAPEQLAGRTVDHRCDVFSLGVILFEMLTDRLGFDAERESAIRKQTQTFDPLVRALELPECLRRLLRSLLRKSVRRRPASMSEVLELLETARRSLGPFASTRGGPAREEIRSSDSPSRLLSLPGNAVREAV